MAIDAKNTLARVAVCLLAIGPAAAWAAEPELEISEQPTDVRRSEIVGIQWAGQVAQVVVERRHGLFWVTEGSDESGEVLLDDSGGGLLSARWQSSYYSPAGLYRIRLDGDGHTITSDEFDVRPCSCIVPGQVRSKWRDGGFRVSLTAKYASEPAGWLEFPTRVTTGRPLVRVLRDGRRIGSMLLRYRRDRFRGTWPGPRGPRHSVVFQLVALTDRFGNG